ncbi:hypothetical protein CPC08DRAFT_527125 [Agrocybe pediades]|nr:hypothetical protein CPC08DRAFT_527125 [Agrocybe pediades]
MSLYSWSGFSPTAPCSLFRKLKLRPAFVHDPYPQCLFTHFTFRRIFQNTPLHFPWFFLFSYCIISLSHSSSFHLFLVTLSCIFLPSHFSLSVIFSFERAWRMSVHATYIHTP